jgi:chromosomal replication initiation ATPase DnaA
VLGLADRLLFPGGQWPRLRDKLERVNPEDGEVILTAPTRVLRDRIAMQYGDRLLELWRAEYQRVTSVSIVEAAVPAHSGNREESQSAESGIALAVESSSAHLGSTRETAE